MLVEQRWLQPMLARPCSYFSLMAKRVATGADWREKGRYVEEVEVAIAFR